MRTLVEIAKDFKDAVSRTIHPKSKVCHSVRTIKELLEDSVKNYNAEELNVLRGYTEQYIRCNEGAKLVIQGQQITNIKQLCEQVTLLPKMDDETAHHIILCGVAGEMTKKYTRIAEQY